MKTVAFSKIFSSVPLPWDTLCVLARARVCVVCIEPWKPCTFKECVSAYGTADRAAANIMHKAKSDYFSSRTAQSNCCKELFSVCNELRGCNSDLRHYSVHLLHCLCSDLSLPTAFPICDCDLPDAFADWCVREVKTIRDELDVMVKCLCQSGQQMTRPPDLPCIFLKTCVNAMCRENRWFDSASAVLSLQIKRIVDCGHLSCDFVPHN